MCCKLNHSRLTLHFWSFQVRTHAHEADSAFANSTAARVQAHETRPSACILTYETRECTFRLFRSGFEQAEKHCSLRFLARGSPASVPGDFFLDCKGLDERWGRLKSSGSTLSACWSMRTRRTSSRKEVRSPLAFLNAVQTTSIVKGYKSCYRTCVSYRDLATWRRNLFRNPVSLPHWRMDASCCEGLTGVAHLAIQAAFQATKESRPDLTDYRNYVAVPMD
ncbi:hypothetical protein KM043_013541 [Ampulex compressa]|nr:hypothetical protein KM043_013541 [Ampulex compressa]